MGQCLGFLMRFRFIVSYFLTGISEKSGMHFGDLHRGIARLSLYQTVKFIYANGEMVSLDGDRVKRSSGQVFKLNTGIKPLRRASGRTCTFF